MPAVLFELQNFVDYFYFFVDLRERLCDILVLKVVIIISNSVLVTITFMSLVSRLMTVLVLVAFFGLFLGAFRFFEASHKS